MKHARIGRIGLAGLIFLLAGCAPGPRNSQPPQHQVAPVTAPAHSDNGSGHLREGAPLRYTVKPGDTLWSIASIYLADPWYWPQIWDENPNIKNPHLIYPGDVLLLRHGRLIRLAPHVRVEQLPIPTISYDALHKFLQSPRLVDKKTLDEAPYVVAFADRQLVAAKGATVYVRNLPRDHTHRYILIHPDGYYRDHQTNRILGYKAIPVGTITIEKSGGTVATATIDKSYREAYPGDRLLPVLGKKLARDFHPHAPAQPISAYIISVYGGVSQIGQYDVVTLDRGHASGVQRGDVFEIYQPGGDISDPIAGDKVSLPDIKSGRLMIFKVNDKVSYGLIMHATRAIHVGDIARTPESS